MPKILSAAEVVSTIPNGATVASVGVIGWVTPDAVLKALGERFRQTGSPRDVTNAVRGARSAGKKTVSIALMRERKETVVSVAVEPLSSANPRPKAAQGTHPKQ